MPDRPPKSVALEKLTRQHQRIEHVPPDTSSEEFKKWKRDTRVAVANVFDESSQHVREFEKINYGLTVFVPGRTPDSEFTKATRDGLRNASAMLASMIDEVNE